MNDQAEDVVCPECDGIIFVEKSPDDEVKDFGEYAATCIECGIDYTHLRKTPMGDWIDANGTILEKA